MWKELLKRPAGEKGGRRGGTEPQPPPLGLQAPEGRLSAGQAEQPYSYL